MSRLLGAVLAGGEARRFGADKAMALLDGKPLIGHAVDVLQPHVAAIAICGRPFGTLPALADRPMPGLGPLGGLNAALRYAVDHDFDTVLTLGCDTPSLPPAVIAALLRHGPTVALRSLPICGLWRAGDADRLEAHLAGGDDRSMRGWVAQCRGDWHDAEVELANVNTPADLAALTAKSV